jgi:hypothetical protein
MDDWASEARRVMTGQELVIGVAAVAGASFFGSLFGIWCGLRMSLSMGKELARLLEEKR